MTTTLLAVDDSRTMRKVLELTFAGESYRVVTVDSADAALAKLRSERPALVLADVTLEGTDGYALCQKIKAENPTTPVIILSSRQQPYDAAKGSAARADGHLDKPFDTQHLIDKVKKALGQPVAAAPASPFASSRSGASWAATSAGPPRPAPPAAASGLRHTPAPAPVAAAPRRTLSYTTDSRPPAVPAPSRPSTPSLSSPVSAPSSPPVIPAVPPSSPAARPAPPPRPAPSPPRAPAPPSPAAAAPAPAPAPAAKPAPAPAAAKAPAVELPSDLQSKLSDLGLTEAQVSGVLALSREVVEKVVWEVVPALAETMIKEEIARLTADE